MPLVRFELKNEYGLGDPRLYQGAPKKDEDPRNILGGVTVSGLVGILRQLGDLAEFAAVVFHDVHQQVTTTAARGHKVLNRIQKIEAALPRFEKAIQEQKNHIHFAYIAGCDWHANIKTGQSQFFGSDLPEFMMDSYEECRDPPPLHLLDKFDSAGSGACLKRYSDPSHFQRLMSSSESVMFEKAHNGMKVQRKKNQRSRGRNGLPYHSIHTTLHGRSLNSSVHCASLVTDELSFSVDDASISDSLSTSGFTNELIYFSSDKRSGCLELQNTPSSRSKEPYDVLSATEVETKQKVDCFFNNDNKVSASDYVIQDSFHQQNALLSSSISSDEKIEMVKSVNQMLSHDIPEDGLKNPKTEELSSALSNRDHGTDGLGMQGECVSRSLTWDESATGNPETPGGVSSTYSAAWNEKAEIMESTSPKFPDDIIPCKPIDSDLLFGTLETSSQHSEMNDTEMLNQENGLLDTMKLVVQSSAGGQISELISQLDKHMDTTDALGSKIQTNFEYHTEQGVILLPHLNYDGMECETNKILGVASPSFDGEISHEAHTSLKKKFSSQVFDHVQSAGSAESAHRLHYSAENAVSEYLTSDSTMINDSERINNAPCSGVIIPSTQDVLIDGIPPEESLSRNSFGDSSAKAASEKEVLREHQTKQETESTAVSNYQGTEYQSSMNKVIAASKSDFLDSKTNVASFNSASCPGIIISSTQAVVIDGIPPEESLSQDSFGDTSAKTASEKEELCKHQTIREIQSTADSNCQGTEYQRTMEKLIAASKLDGPDSETHVASFNRATYTGAIIKQPVVIDVIPPEESLSQDSFGVTSANTAAEKDVLCEHQTKQETVSTAESNCQGTEYQSSMENVIAASKFDGLNYESHVASCGSSDDYASPILCGLIISNSVDTTSSSRISSEVTSSRSPIHILSPRSDSEDPGGNMSAPLINTSEILLSDVTAATTVEFQGFDSFRKSSINIWTNGGLLGLEPSKPPDTIVPNVYDSDDIYDERSATNSQPRVLGHGNKSRKLFFEAEKLNHVVSFSEHDNIMGKISDEQSDSILSKQHLKDSIQASSFCKLDKVQNAYFGGTALEIDRVRGKEGGNISSETNIYSKYEPESTVSRQNNSSFSVGFSSLAHRFLVNSLQRKSSMTGICPLSELMNNNAHKLHGTKIHSKDKARPKLAISSAPLHKLENKEDFAHEFSEKLVSPSLYSSGYQSPPLEDMKISFQPMNDSEASKLKLEFCSSQLQGNMGDMMFPSFQLLTESFQPLLDGVLESDDDTFCRSCPYSSDDLLSLHSESDAEIWGEDEIDFSHRIEVSVSISSSVEFNASNCCRVSQVNDVTNLKHGSDEPSFNSGDIIDHPNASFLEISQRQLHTCNPSMQHTDLLSLQPSSPFPPTQWRVMKPSFSYIKNTISADVETDRSVGSLPTDRSASHQLQD